MYMLPGSCVNKEPIRKSSIATPKKHINNNCKRIINRSPAKFNAKIKVKILKQNFIIFTI